MLRIISDAPQYNFFGGEPRLSYIYAGLYGFGFFLLLVAVIVLRAVF